MIPGIGGTRKSYFRLPNPWQSNEWKHIYNGSNWYKTHCKDLQWFFTTGSKIKDCFLMTVLISKIRNTDRYEANIFLTKTFYLFKIFFFVWSYSIFISTNSSIRDRFSIWFWNDSVCFVHHVNESSMRENCQGSKLVFFLFFNLQYALVQERYVPQILILNCLELQQE